MMASQPREYTPKCVLVTGGAGFIASFVVTRLLKAPNSDHRVVVFDKMDYCASVRNLDAVANHPNLVIVKGNILDHKAVLDALRMHEVDTVMHFAAQSHVDNSFGNSMSFSLNNTLGTHMLLEACRLAGTIRRFINVSTDEVYGGVDFEWEERLDEKVTFYATVENMCSHSSNAFMMSVPHPPRSRDWNQLIRIRQPKRVQKCSSRLISALINYHASSREGIMYTDLTNFQRNWYLSSAS